MKSAVVIYFSELGGRLRLHQKEMLEVEAKAIADIMDLPFLGVYDRDGKYPEHLFFVPDDTLLLNEAKFLGISHVNDFYGGVVHYPFLKSKAITHPLINDRAIRPEGWSEAFAEQVSDVVLPGYSAFSIADARAAANRLLADGPVRLKRPLGSQGTGQVVITDNKQLDSALSDLPQGDVETYGIVMERALQKVTTRSVGFVAINCSTMSYFGTQ